ncbi:hypothetical protein SG34_013670 [Thalassomonas viridans]|uniref:Uncharacterized protein n=1 Tax=Thalassomonas viridans TaxID=137584 RepID=A0AAF0CC33_9GAMM|nr:hypothetical protein [Thalassomonas viridans]WDE07831.1 hypothetical protein SG34_013670 [Thalassomonas viridans]
MFNREKFDQEQLAKSITVETNIGKSLMTNPLVNHIAVLIRLYSGAPMSKSAMTEEDQQHLQKILSFIGGARDLDNDHDTLDAHVLATHIKIDRAENNEIYAPDPNRRQNRFNVVGSKQNPIYPWNCHDFDMAVHEVDSWDGLPAQMQEIITQRWSSYRFNDEKFALVMSFQSLGDIDNTGLRNWDAKTILSCLQEKERKIFLYDILDIKWSPCEWLSDGALNNSLSGGLQSQDNPLGSNLRQHNTGFLANIVQSSAPDDPNVEKWASEAIRRNRPVISGPSGHSLRYLNFWAECRRLYIYKDERYDQILPSLEDARLVMMANLLPPKNHHSYHEIMCASIGVSDGVNTLAYLHQSSYDDLENGPLYGKQALDTALLALNNPNKEPLPNPWAVQAPVFDIKLPETASDLAGLLWQFGSSPEYVIMLLKAASSNLRLSLILELQQRLQNGSITKLQHDFVLEEIRKLETVVSCSTEARLTENKDL